MESLLVDCHIHLNNYTRRYVPTEENLQALLKRMKRFKVDHALVLTSYMVNEHRPRTDHVIDLVRDHSEISVVEGITFEDGKPADLEGVRQRLETREVVGLKMYPGYLPFYPFDDVCEPVYELAQEFKVPVMFHTGDTYAKGAKVKYSQPIHIDDVAVDHPDMDIVICHLGNPWFRDTAELLYKNENVYADISGLVLESFEQPLERWVAEEVRELIMYAGDPESLLYGTDWPLVKMGPYLNFVRGLGLSEKSMERIMWRNANRLFKLNLPARKRKSEAGSRKPRTTPVVETKEKSPSTGRTGSNRRGA